MAFMQSVKKFIRDEEGVVTIEYALIAAILAVGLIAGLVALQTDTKTLIANIDAAVKAVSGAIGAVDAGVSGAGGLVATAGTPTN